MSRRWEHAAPGTPARARWLLGALLTAPLLLSACQSAAPPPEAVAPPAPPPPPPAKAAPRAARPRPGDAACISADRRQELFRRFAALQDGEAAESPAPPAPAPLSASSSRASPPRASPPRASPCKQAER